MNGRARTLSRAATDRVAAADLHEPTGLQHLMVRHGQATAAELISQEPVSELRVIGMGIEDGVGGMRVGPFPLADRFGQPLVVGLTGEPEDPAGEFHGNPVAGQVLHDGIGHFGD